MLAQKYPKHSEHSEHLKSLRYPSNSIPMTWNNHEEAASILLEREKNRRESYLKTNPHVEPLFREYFKELVGVHIMQGCLFMDASDTSEDTVTLFHYPESDEDVEIYDPSLQDFMDQVLGRSERKPIFVKPLNNKRRK